MKYGGRVSENTQHVCKCRVQESVRCPGRIRGANCRLKNKCTAKPLVIMRCECILIANMHRYT